jgi:nitric oxide reductase NorQ protein
LLLEAHPSFLLVISYNPGYQSVMKDLKHSTRQRFTAIEISHPSADKEKTIIMTESGVDEDTAGRLVRLGEMIRNLRQHGLEEGISTRLLVYDHKRTLAPCRLRGRCNAAHDRRS